jgi:hypothetical protein
VEPETAGAFALHVRIPGWAREEVVPSDLYRFAEPCREEARILVNGEPAAFNLEKGFAVLRRDWEAGDIIELSLPMPARRILAHENVKDDVGRVALQRGPIVYCAEGADNGGRVLNRVLPDAAAIRTEPRPELLGGVTILRAAGQARQRSDDGTPTLQPAEIVWVPYYAWNHRGPNEMAVWMARSPELAEIEPLPTLAAKAQASASHVNPRDTLEALNDQLDPKASGDHSLPRFTWWDHRGTAEWVQYEWPQDTRMTGVEVYWFDDTGVGQCRVPKSWRLLAKTGESWQPIAGDHLPIQKDSFNRITFPAVSCAGVRIEVQLQPGSSGGILEWRVLP